MTFIDITPDSDPQRYQLMINALLDIQQHLLPVQITISSGTHKGHILLGALYEVSAQEFTHNINQIGLELDLDEQTN
jgi:hypothetical protein